MKRRQISSNIGLVRPRLEPRSVSKSRSTYDRVSTTKFCRVLEDPTPSRLDDPLPNPPFAPRPSQLFRSLHEFRTRRAAHASTRCRAVSDVGRTRGRTAGMASSCRAPCRVHSKTHCKPRDDHSGPPNGWTRPCGVTFKTRACGQVITKSKYIDRFSNQARQKS